MKLKNITNSIQKVINLNNGWESLVGPKETIEIKKPKFNKKYFIIINEKGGEKDVQDN